MGRRDRRNSMKMRRKKAQRRKKMREMSKRQGEIKHPKVTVEDEAAFFDISN